MGIFDFFKKKKKQESLEETIEKTIQNPEDRQKFLELKEKLDGHLKNMSELNYSIENNEVDIETENEKTIKEAEEVLEKLKNPDNMSQEEIDGTFKKMFESGFLDDLDVGNKKDIEEVIENKNGFNRYFGPDGTKVEFNAKNGSVEGLFKTFYPSGEKLSEAVYENNHPISFTKFHLNGQISETGNMKNGQIDGLLKKYYESGALAEESIWENGEMNGEYKYFYENSLVDREGVYKDGKEHGHWKFYYENGNLDEEYNWEDGIQNGPYKKYYENGILQVSGNVKYGAQSGVWKKFDKNGEFEEEFNFDK